MGSAKTHPETPVVLDSLNMYGFWAPGGLGTRTLEARAEVAPVCCGRPSDCLVCCSSWLTLLHMAPWARPANAPDALGFPLGTCILNYSHFLHPYQLPFCSASNCLSLSPPVSLCFPETVSFAKMSLPYGTFSVPLCLNLIYPILEFLVSDCAPV